MLNLGKTCYSDKFDFEFDRKSNLIQLTTDLVTVNEEASKKRSKIL
jgi:hypothetical protein